MRLRKVKTWLYIFLAIIILGYFIPQHFKMPVADATKKSYDQKSFWFYPWGTSVTHKGVDIFAKEGTAVTPSTFGLVIYTGQINKGGNVVLILGPKWRLHYYAHLKKIKTQSFRYVNSSDIIGTVGTTGNAQGKPPHLHYTIRTIIPYIWRIDGSAQGWKKMFYLNPIQYLNDL